MLCSGVLLVVVVVSGDGVVGFCWLLLFPSRLLVVDGFSCCGLPQLVVVVLFVFCTSVVVGCCSLLLLLLLLLLAVVAVAVACWGCWLLM